MVFVSKKENKRQRKVAKRIFKRTGQRVGFATSIGGGGGLTPTGSSPSFGVQTPEGIRISTERGIGAGNTVTSIAQPIGVPRVSGTRTRTRREIQLSESKKGDLFCEMKIVKGKRKRVCRTKTIDKKIKKPIRRVSNVDKQFGFFGRIL